VDGGAAQFWDGLLAERLVEMEAEDGPCKVSTAHDEVERTAI
jgi:hypothetical protein